MNREAAGSSPAPRVEKLYVVVRRDLEVGLRTAQAGHALIGWVMEYGRPPDNLVVLAVPSLEELHRVYDRCRDVRMVGFHEPDLNDELTAVAVGPEGWRALSSLPLLR